MLLCAMKDATALILLSRSALGNWLIVVKRFRGELLFKAHRLVYDSTLGLRAIQKKKKVSS